MLRRNIPAENADTLRAVQSIGSSPGIDATFNWPVRIYYEDTDAGGVVYYANYLKFFERCRTEWLRALGLDQATLAHEQGLCFVVAEIEAKYLAPARLDDQLTIGARIAALGRCSLRFEQHASRSGEVIARARVTVACVDAQRRLPARLPESIRARLSGR
jgi:acyl-CoA thioester hydrolase